MSKRVILFLSAVKDGSYPENTYTCPDGSTVTGTYANDAPVRYLLKQYPDITEILCITTDEARTSALEMFEKNVHAVSPAVTITDIPYHENDTDFNSTMQTLLKRLTAEDQICLETTGGFRNTIMFLMLLSRVLTYSGITMLSIVYCNYKLQQVEDISRMFHMFNLVNGMEELTSFGSIRTLRQYYGKPAQDPYIESLLAAIEELIDNITLCRTRNIDGCMEKFNRAMDEMGNSEDLLIKMLLPAFRGKYGKKLTVPGLIRWCVASGMLQQALTVYNERIPAYLIRIRNDLLFAPVDLQPPYYEYEDPDGVVFTKGLLNLSWKEVNEQNLVKQLRFYFQKNTEEVLDYIQSGIPVYYIPESLTAALDNLKLIAKLAYPEGYFYENWYKNLPEDKQYLSELKVTFNDLPAVNMEKMINKCTTIAQWQGELLLQKTDEIPATKMDLDNERYIRTIQNMQKLVSESDFVIKCSIEQMQTICRDYVYIRLLRNMINHASETGTASQKTTIQYLMEYGYPHPKDAGAEDIRQILLKALDNLKAETKKESKNKRKG